jgi:hypothetical protein
VQHPSFRHRKADRLTRCHPSTPPPRHREGIPPPNPHLSSALEAAPLRSEQDILEVELEVRIYAGHGAGGKLAGSFLLRSWWRCEMSVSYTDGRYACVTWCRGCCAGTGASPRARPTLMPARPAPPAALCLQSRRVPRPSPAWPRPAPGPGLGTGCGSWRLSREHPGQEQRGEGSAWQSGTDLGRSFPGAGAATHSQHAGGRPWVPFPP